MATVAAVVFASSAPADVQFSASVSHERVSFSQLADDLLGGVPALLHVGERGPETIDRLAELVEARLGERRAAGEDVLLTPTAAAEIAGVHPETIRRAIRSGALEVAGYVGNRARVRRAAVDAWVAEGRRVDPVVQASRVAAVRGRGSHARVLRDALDLERAA